MVCEIFVPTKPYPAPRPRFDSRSRRAYSPKEYEQVKQAIGLLARSKIKKPLEDAVRVELEFSYTAPKSWSKAKKDETIYKTSRPDLDNLAKTVLDALNGIAFVDDSQVVELELSKVYASIEGIHIRVVEL